MKESLQNILRAERTWLLAVNFCLAVALAHGLASLVWQIAGNSGVTAIPADMDRSATSTARPPERPPMQVAREAELFGKAGRVEVSPVPLSSDSRSAPPTTLNLELKGIIAAEPMSRALAAIVEKGGKKEQLYAVGDKVPGNGVVAEIHFDRVLLRRGGTLETLMLADGKKGAPPPRARKKGLRNGSDAPEGRISSLGDGIRWQIDESYLKQRLADIPGLAREVGVEIYREGDVQKGYRLVSARGSKLLNEMGLQPGDILNEVNGLPLNSVHDGLSAYQNLRNAREIRVVITRNGRRETRIYNVNNGG